MADIRIHREHALGLETARDIARQWAREVESRFDMSCSVLEGEFSDTVSFRRTGVSGELIVAADHFDLQARLGFLLGAFAGTIEREILKNLDDLLGQAARPARAAGRAGRATAAPAAARAGAPAKAPAAKKKPAR